MVFRSTPLRIRPFRRDEPETLDAVFDGLSARARFMRFHGPAPRLTESVRRALMDVDGSHHIALVAETAGGDGTARPIGIVRCVRTRVGGTTADVAIMVADAWQRRGVGRSLVAALAERAAEEGITRLQARALPTNYGAVALFRAAFPSGFTIPDDDAIVMIALMAGAGALEVTLDDVLADLAK
ncbi:GNAT family N-acetyltransferase [Pseudonocardia sp. TRM90224]|uniref:GNAT family N-acetyltransferase n=1 Tax=Pseudonocardia sp. TRM90224 TaxID=2812678 RepID=UPI001E499B13|nr:GNAT family N-acetyltransferase [Pseudonocardia sp. TRM90224]